MMTTIELKSQDKRGQTCPRRCLHHGPGRQGCFTKKPPRWRYANEAPNAFQMTVLNKRSQTHPDVFFSLTIQCFVSPILIFSCTWLMIILFCNEDLITALLREQMKGVQLKENNACGMGVRRASIRVPGGWNTLIARSLQQLKISSNLFLTWTLETAWVQSGGLNRDCNFLVKNISI